MLTANLTLTLHLLLNSGYVGDNNQVEAIKEQIVSQAPGANITVASYQDDATDTITKLKQDLAAPGQHE